MSSWLTNKVAFASSITAVANEHKYMFFQTDFGCHRLVAPCCSGVLHLGQNCSVIAGERTPMIGEILTRVSVWIYENNPNRANYWVT